MRDIKQKLILFNLCCIQQRRKANVYKEKSKPAFKHRLMDFYTKTYDNFDVTIQARTISTDIIREKIFKYLGNSNIQYGSNSDTPNDEFYDTANLLTTDEYLMNYIEK